MFGLTALLLTGLAAEPAEPALGLVFDATIPERERPQLRAAFEEALAVACKSVPCTERECEPDATTLRLTLSGSDRVYALAWELRGPQIDGGMRLDSVCDLCGVNEVGVQIGSDLGQLCARLDALDTSMTTVDTPAPQPSEPPRCDTQPVTAQPRPRWPGWAGLGAGLLLGSAGATLIGIHGAPWQKQCTGNDVDADGDCRWSLATRPLGIALAVTGAIVLGSGVGLTVWASGKRGHEGAGINLSWRF